MKRGENSPPFPHKGETATLFRLPYIEKSRFNFEAAFLLLSSSTQSVFACRRHKSI